MTQLSLIAASLLIASSVVVAKTTPLTLEVYNADENSFNVNSTLIIGKTEVMVIDTRFTKADALRIAAKVLDTGKTLNTIFISQADPDYYFGAEHLHALFPDAKIITTPAVRKVIEQKLPNKLKVWAPQMGKNAPVTPYLPEAYTGTNLTIDGHKVEIRGTQGIWAHSPYLWIPSHKAILGNVSISSGLHVWTADSQTDAAYGAWTAQLDEIKALNAQVVIPGHMTAGQPLSANAINDTKQYLADFAQAKQASANSGELIEKMTQKYPHLESPTTLDLSAKVHMGEMKW